MKVKNKCITHYKICIYSFQATAPIAAYKKGVIFLGGISPSKIGHNAPYLDTIQALSKARVFVLLSENERKLLCMGHTSTANKPLPLNNSPKPICGSWESNPAYVKASKN
jgi:hypothetical protein